jgi:DNA-binding XRE family transcriptional regulator
MIDEMDYNQLLVDLNKRSIEVEILQEHLNICNIEREKYKEKINLAIGIIEDFNRSNPLRAENFEKFKNNVVDLKYIDKYKHFIKYTTFVDKTLYYKDNELATVIDDKFLLFLKNVFEVLDISIRTYKGLTKYHLVQMEGKDIKDKLIGE